MLTFLDYLDANSVDGKPQILREAQVIVDKLSLKKSAGHSCSIYTYFSCACDVFTPYVCGVSVCGVREVVVCGSISKSPYTCMMSCLGMCSASLMRCMLMCKCMCVRTCECLYECMCASQHVAFRCVIVNMLSLCS